VVAADVPIAEQAGPAGPEGFPVLLVGCLANVLQHVCPSIERPCGSTPPEDQDTWPSQSRFSSPRADIAIAYVTQSPEKAVLWVGDGGGGVAAAGSSMRRNLY
jgi:hypothetical protein